MPWLELSRLLGEHVGRWNYWGKNCSNMVLPLASHQKPCVFCKKNKLKPWQVKSWCIPEVTPEFIKHREHILELYHKPYDSKRSMVCFDEKSIQFWHKLQTHWLSDLGTPLDKTMNTKEMARVICSCSSSRRLAFVMCW